MKILFTHELFPPDVVGGGEKLTLKMIHLLRERGHEIKVLTSGDPAIKEYDGIRTIRIPKNRYLMNLEFKKVLEEAAGVDIIQTSSGNMALPSWKAARKLKIPICCHIHHIFGSYWRDVRGPILGPFFQLGEKIILTKPYDAIVFQNYNSKNIGLKIGIDEKRIHMVQPGIDWEKYQMKIKKEPFVLFVGSFNMDKPQTKIKGLNYLLNVARKLPYINFLIVGGGREIDKMKMHFEKNIIFTGPLVGKTLIEIYNRALIFCLPSLTEGFGISLLEAMASGCATISTVDIGQEGPKIQPKDTDQLIRSIKYLIENENVAKEIGNKNRKIARKFTWERFIENYLKIYESISQN
ncbi:MAG: glycosyltransferase family 4 protein [Candidatus Aenigmatarchaeota archaeon]